MKVSEWKKERCTLQPPEFDFESSPGHIIERKNIAPVAVTDENTGETRTEYECEMRFLTVKEYTQNIKVLQDTVDALIVSSLEV